MMQKQQQQHQHQRLDSGGGLTDNNMNTVMQPPGSSGGPTGGMPNSYNNMSYYNQSSQQPQTQQQQGYGGYRQSNNAYHQQPQQTMTQGGQQGQGHHMSGGNTGYSNHAGQQGGGHGHGGNPYQMHNPHHMQGQQGGQHQGQVGQQHQGQPQQQQQYGQKMTQQQQYQYQQQQNMQQQSPMRWRDPGNAPQQPQQNPPTTMAPAAAAPALMQYRDTSCGNGSRASPYPLPPSNEPPESEPCEDGPCEDGGTQLYGQDRIQNELLSEIYLDYGIKDSMDLDFLDFDTNDAGGEAPFMFEPAQTGSADDLLDITEDFINRSSATDNEKLAVAGMTRKLESPALVMPTIPAPSSVKSEHDKVDSPTVSSSSSEEVPNLSRQSSVGPAAPPTTAGPHGACSPHVHSTTHEAPVVTAASSVDASEPAFKQSNSSGEDAPRPSPASASGSTCSTSSCHSAIVPPPPPQRSISVDSNASMPPASPRQGSMHHGSVTTLPPASPRMQHRASIPNADSMNTPQTVNSNTLSKTSGFTATIRSEHFTSFSQPASPAKGAFPNAGNMQQRMSFSHDNLPSAARSLTGHPGFQMPPQQQATSQPQHGRGDGFRMGAQSQMPGPSNRFVKPEPSGPNYDDGDIPVAELNPSSLPTTADHLIPAIQNDGCSSGASSQPDSPSAIHVAKRARTINSGTDLLHEMRERYSYVKDVSIYDPPTRPQSQMHSPTHSHNGFQFNDMQQQQQQQQHTYQGNPASTSGNYGYNNNSNTSINSNNNMMHRQNQGPVASQGAPMDMYGPQAAQGAPTMQGRVPQAAHQGHPPQGWYNNNSMSANPMQQHPQSSHNRSQYMDNSNIGGGYGPHGPHGPHGPQTPGPAHAMGGMPNTPSTPHMNPHMGGPQTPHPAHMHQQGMMGGMGPGGPRGMGPGGMGPGTPMGGGYMPPGTPQGHPRPEMMNSAQTFSVNQPLGSQLPPHQQTLLPSDPSKPMTAQQGLMHSIINDDSEAFKSHPLFPLLRDLIIADLNFHTASFPFQLIANLPAEFDKLLMNYQNRNPPSRAYPGPPATKCVIMDALRYAHQSLIEKIQVKKRETGYQDANKPLHAIEDFCERFNRAVVKNNNEPGGPSTSSSAAGAGGMYGGAGGPNSRSTNSLPSTPSKSSTSKSNADKDSTDSKPKTTATAGRNKVLPKEAVSLMMEWLKDHQDNPYPNDDEKEMLINKTKLTINQINYWFTNARRRILPKWALQRYMDQQKLAQQQHHHGMPQPPGPGPPPGAPYRGMTAS